MTTQAQPEPPRSSTPSPQERFPAEAVAGVTELWRHTQGDPAVTIGVYDGPPDTTHPCLTGADLHTLTTWWLPPAQPDTAAIEHGTYTASVLFGQPGSELPGLAPHCRGLFVASGGGDDDAPNDPLHAARAIDELLAAGADIIQFIPAFHTASGDAEDLFKRAVARAAEAGVLITAPAGNDYGRCGIAPAILPGVLAVGAHRGDGVMYQFSNWGAPYRDHGISAPGGDVLGALPAGGVKARKGTCIAVSMVTGAAALLLSLQRHAGLTADPLEVRDALLRTARPCTGDQAHGAPERCLGGLLDLPAATRLILAAAPTATILPMNAPPVELRGQRTVGQVQTDITITTLAQRPHLTEPHPDEATPSPLTFLRHDPAGQWSEQAGIRAHFPQFHLVATDPHDAIVGRGLAVPFALAAPQRGRLPDRGWDEILLWAFTDARQGIPPDTLGLLSIHVRPDRRGTGLADALLRELKNAARSAGLQQVVAPVRPTRKHHEPAIPMAEYARRTRPDGLPADPWLRTHVRAGGTIVSVAPASMVVAGSLAQWRQWTGLPFDTDGPVHVPEALVPVHCSLAHDHAIYVEPNIWVRHSL